MPMVIAAAEQVQRTGATKNSTYRHVLRNGRCYYRSHSTANGRNNRKSKKLAASEDILSTATCAAEVPGAKHEPRLGMVYCLAC